MRTCVDAVAEAERHAARVREVIERDPDQSREAIETYLRLVSLLGYEVRDEGQSARGRARLRELQYEFSRELTEIMTRRVVPPTIRPYVAQRLSPISDAKLRDRVARNGVLIGRQYIGGSGSRPVHTADLRNAVIIDCRFEEADFSEAQFGANTRLVRTRFRRCNFDMIRAQELRGSGLIFEDCTFGGADLSSTVFGYSVFEVTDPDAYASPELALLSASLSYCTLKGLSLQRVNIAAASFTDCALDGSDLRGASGPSAVFCESTLTGCEFAGADLDSAVFRNCDLRDVSFLGDDMFDDADLSHADLTAAFNSHTVAHSSQHRNAAFWPPEEMVDDVVRALQESLKAVDTSAS